MPAARPSSQLVQDPGYQPDPAEQYIREDRDEKRQHKVGLRSAPRDEGQQSTERCGQEGESGKRDGYVRHGPEERTRAQSWTVLSAVRWWLVRGMLLSGVVGVACLVCVLALGFGLQAAVLPSPAHVDRVAADASRWLNLYHYSIDVFHSRKRRLRGACLRGWYPRAQKPGSLLLLHGGPALLAIEHQPVLFLSRSRRRDFPALLAITTGCTLQLGNALYAAAQGKTRISIEPAYAANQPTLALELPHVREQRLTVYVSARQYRPLVAIATAHGHTTTARIYLTRASPSLRLRYRQLLTRTRRRPPTDG
jgi:hypothetical protein